MARYETEKYGDQAYIIYNVNDGIANASYSYVDPSLRGQGVGYYLVKEWHKLMQEESLNTVGSCGFVQRGLIIIASRAEEE